MKLVATANTFRANNISSRQAALFQKLYRDKKKTCEGGLNVGFINSIFNETYSDYMIVVGAATALHTEVNR